MVTSGQFYGYDLWSKTKIDAGPRVRIDFSDGGYMEFVVKESGVEVRTGFGRLVIKPDVSNQVLVTTEEL